MAVTAGWFEEDGGWYLPAWMFDEDGVLWGGPDDNEDGDGDDLYARA